MPDSLIYEIDHIPASVFDSVPVINIPAEGFEGMDFLVDSALRSDITILLIFAFLFMAFTFRHGFKYFNTLIKAQFSVRNRENVFEHRTMNETSLLFALFLNTAIQGGIIILFSAAYFFDFNLAQVTIAALAACVAAVGLYMCLQYLLYKILCYTFGNTDESQLIIGGLNSTWALLGLALTPITVILALHSIAHFHLIICAFALFVIFKLILAVKVFRIFFVNFNACLLFILYLCTLESVPFVIFLRATIYFYNFLYF
ncbi:MAG: DUF4271 domain-containing protein [Muribaculaceae bacterium]|nr:DUF4271 domain-containing protein [Muribaculaceae bacterium]